MKKPASIHHARELAEQHSELRTQTLRVLDALGHDGGWESVSIELTRLSHALARHFLLEESGGYLSELLAAAPGSVTDIHALETDHKAMGKLLREVRHMVVDEQDLAAVQQKFVQWSEQLARHEQAEHELIDTVLKSTHSH